MELISQHIKRIMEGCKERALDAGLKFDKESLEYIVTNSDMIELSPKNMIPTLYDYWLQDIQVLHGKGEYDYYPHNPYETVINTRPAISFYNDNNPDWLNVMIFYHVLAHIDFFQNNKFFEKTWDYDFKQKALTEKRMIARLRSEKGREVDYIIEFAKSIDNLAGYFDLLNDNANYNALMLSAKADYYFNFFLQSEKFVPMKVFLDEIERYNNMPDTESNNRDELFFSSLSGTYPEFEEMFNKFTNAKPQFKRGDLLQFIMDESKMINSGDNAWMKTVIEIVRETSLYFSPQIRTKTMNEGWASYWHEKLFMQDDRIRGHEVSFARINAKVTAISRVGLNPYAIGWRLFSFIEEMADTGKLSYDYTKILDAGQRKAFLQPQGNGKEFIFFVRENYCDFTFLNRFINQDFVDKHKLMVVGQRIDPQKNTVAYYVKSRKAADYKKMIVDSLYHPPQMRFSDNTDNTLSLEHLFEGKALYSDYIPNTLIGLEYLWGDPVELITYEPDLNELKKRSQKAAAQDAAAETPPFAKVRYFVKDKKVTKTKIA
ncbi:MAG: SpoVR family protein [Ignavibacteriales bacterium]|nr:SpoVR family protein [Ignavibacteriales bacterium]